jgi:CRP-like cAMP-binding protein
MSGDTLGGLTPSHTDSEGRNELCNLISASPAFRDLPWSDVETLVGFMQAYRVAAGQQIFAEGAPGDYLALVLAGRIDILKSDEQNEPKILARLGPGKTVGEMAMIDGERRSATGRASQESLIAVLSRGRFETLIAERPGLGVRLLIRIARILSQRLRLASGQLVDHL